MIEWVVSNWKELLGTGGIGVIIVALINLMGRKTSKPSISQKSRSGKNSTTYQAGESINIENTFGERKGTSNE